LSKKDAPTCSERECNLNACYVFDNGQSKCLDHAGKLPKQHELPIQFLSQVDREAIMSKCSKAKAEDRSSLLPNLPFKTWAARGSLKELMDTKPYQDDSDSGDEMSTGSSTCDESVVNPSFDAGRWSYKLGQLYTLLSSSDHAEEDKTQNSYANTTFSTVTAETTHAKIATGKCPTPNGQRGGVSIEEGLACEEGFNLLGNKSIQGLISINNAVNAAIGRSGIDYKSSWLPELDLYLEDGRRRRRCRFSERSVGDLTIQSCLPLTAEEAMHMAWRLEQIIALFTSEGIPVLLLNIGGTALDQVFGYLFNCGTVYDNQSVVLDNVGTGHMALIPGFGWYVSHYRGRPLFQLEKMSSRAYLTGTAVSCFRQILTKSCQERSLDSPPSLTTFFEAIVTDPKALFIGTMSRYDEAILSMKTRQDVASYESFYRHLPGIEKLAKDEDGKRKYENFEEVDNKPIFYPSKSNDKETYNYIHDTLLRLDEDDWRKKRLSEKLDLSLMRIVGIKLYRSEPRDELKNKSPNEKRRRRES